MPHELGGWLIALSAAGVFICYGIAIHIDKQRENERDAADSDSAPVLLKLTRKDADDIHSALLDAAIYARMEAPNMGPSKELMYLADSKRCEQLAMVVDDALRQRK